MSGNDDIYARFAKDVGFDNGRDHPRIVGKNPLLSAPYGADTSLTFKALREANVARYPMFKNAKGESLHNGQDWTANDWLVATLGELGETANILKKCRRGDFTIGEARDKLARELSDVAIYLDLYAWSQAVSLDNPSFGDTFANMRKANRATAPVLHPGNAPNDTMVDALRLIGSVAYLHSGTTALASRLRALLYCVDWLADQCAIDLGEAVMKTFNAKSDQLELELHLMPTGYTTNFL